MNTSFLQKIYLTHQECTECPSTSTITQFFNELLAVLFPDFAHAPTGSFSAFEEKANALQQKLLKIFHHSVLPLQAERREVTDAFFSKLPFIYGQLQLDIDAMYEGDPAANNRSEVVRCYPGFYAIAAYRVAHALANLGVQNVPRIITEHAHSRTGIDIHPGAQIGSHFCIDHGTGVVIGETTEIGNHVKVYQGVTLGALSVEKKDAKTKRHPTIEDHVVLYAGATILGGQTTIGHHSTIGGNVWLTKSIPPHSRVYYQAMMHSETDEQPDRIIVKHL